MKMRLIKLMMKTLNKKNQVELSTQLNRWVPQDSGGQMTQNSMKKNRGP
jgi:hypothetical protein